MFTWDRRRHRPSCPAPDVADDAVGFDVEVDVLCVGIGPATLTAAISAANAGLDVLVVECRREDVQEGGAGSTTPRSWATELRTAWGAETLSGATTTYLRRLTKGVVLPQTSESTDAVTLRALDEPAKRPKKSKGADRVAPFYGRDLPTWAYACLSSPYGMMFSRITIPGSREVIQRSGERLEINSIGPPPGDASASVPLSTALMQLAGRSGAEFDVVGPIRRLAFDGHQVVGAEFGSQADGLAVHTRHGVALGTHGGDLDALELGNVWRSTGAHLALVSSVASRFARLELLMGGLPGTSSERGSHRSSRKMIPS